MEGLFGVILVEYNLTHGHTTMGKLKKGGEGATWQIISLSRSLTKVPLCAHHLV